MKRKKLSLKIAAHTRLHVNKDFVTNGAFALRSSLFHVLAIEADSDLMRSYDVNGRGSLGENFGSSLNSEKVERVFNWADAEEYENERPELRSPEKIYAGSGPIKITGEMAVQHIAPRYFPLFERLATIPGGQWQVNASDPMKALRFVLNGKTEALLMPCKAAV